MALPTSLRSTPRSSGFETKSKAPSFSARTADSTLPCAVMTATGTVGTVFLDPGDEIEPIAVGQPHVGQTQIEALGLQQFPRGAEVRRRARGEIHAAEREADELEEIRLVIDDQDDWLLRAVAHRGGGLVHHVSHRRGSANTSRNRLPPPIRGS